MDRVEADTVETERMLLRPLRPDDIDPLAVLFADPAVWRYPVGRGLTREESKLFLERQISRRETDGFAMWAAELKESNELIGFIGLSVPVWLPEVLPAVEAGWRLTPRCWGRGLATEGARASVRYGFDVLALDRIISIYMPDNEASGRVMTKLGMRDWLITKDPTFGHTIHIRAITVDEWRQGAGGG